MAKLWMATLTQLHWHILIQPPFFGITDSDIYKIYIYICRLLYTIYCIYNYIHISIYHLVMTNSSPWKIPSINGGLVRFSLGKSSISIRAMAGYGFHGYHRPPGPSSQASTVCNGEIWRKCCGPAVPTSRSCQRVEWWCQPFFVIDVGNLVL